MQVDNNNRIIVEKIRARITIIIKERVEIGRIDGIAIAMAKVTEEGPMAARILAATIRTTTTIIINEGTGSSTDAIIEMRTRLRSTTRRRKKAGSSENNLPPISRQLPPQLPIIIITT